MNKNELLKNLEKLNMRPGRGLGQNFLLDNNLLEFIARSANITPGEVVLEVGPGFGALTEKLLAHGAELYAGSDIGTAGNEFQQIVVQQKVLTQAAPGTHIEFFQIFQQLVFIHSSVPDKW